jgi:hypothetical protein
MFSRLLLISVLGTSAFATDYFQDIIDESRDSSGGSGSDYFVRLQLSENSSENTGAYSNVLTAIDDLIKEELESNAALQDAFGSDIIDEKIQDALAKNSSGKYQEALGILRDLVRDTDFQNLKVQYYCARQYVICYERDVIPASARDNYRENLRYHLNGVHEKIQAELLDEQQEEFYSAGYTDISLRSSRFLSEVPSTSSDSSFSNTVAAVEETHSENTSASSIDSSFEAASLSWSSGTPVSQGNATADVGAVSNGGGLESLYSSVPALRLSINSASDVTRQNAEQMLRAMGFINSRRDFNDALKGLSISCTYSRSNNSFDADMKQYIFENWQLYKQALAKYSNMSEISERKTPELYERWIESAADRLTSLGTRRERVALMKSLMTQESGRTQWKNYVPVVSGAGAIGTGQFLYATAKDVGINPFDPKENIEGIAIYMNRLIRSKGSLRKALACYNGGNNPPAESYGYAASIMGRMDSLA